MSTLGRQNNTTDDNISSINLLIEGIETNIEGIETNIEEIEVNVHQIEGNVEILNVSVNVLKDLVGCNLDPPGKTGIFLSLQNLENASNIIPAYKYASIYYPLLDKIFAVLTDGSPEFCNIKINNDDNKNLNNVLTILLKDIEILKKNQKLDRTMITQAGYGLGSTRITSMVGTNITFNTRDINAFVDTSMIPTFQTPDGNSSTPLFSEDYVQDKQSK